MSIRFWMLWVAGLAVVGWYLRTDPDGGAETAARIQWMAWVLVAAGPSYLLRRALMNRARAADAYRVAMRTSTGAGLVFLGLCVLTGIIFAVFATQARAADDQPPVAAREHLPTLAAELDAHWPGAQMRSAVAAQVEQETCPRLTSAKCWNPRTELKTAREYGFGLGQITVTSRFDNFASARGLHASLRDWQWDDRYDPARQLRTLVLMDRGLFMRLYQIDDARERMAMVAAAYNGGFGGLGADRRVCAMVEGCDPARWFGHVERHSTKSRTPAREYGRSFYDINRGYVRAVMIERRVRYVRWAGES